MEQIKRKDIEIDIKWAPGHAEIKGNEEADRLAKEALLNLGWLVVAKPQLAVVISRCTFSLYFL